MRYTWCREVLWQQEWLSGRFEGEKGQEDKAVIRRRKGKS